MSQQKYKGVLRENPKKKLEWEEVTSKKANKKLKKQQNGGSSKGGKSYPCKVCDVIAQSEKALHHHEATCLKLVVDPSKPGFYDQTKKLFPAEVAKTPTREKLIVLSQPSGGPTYASVVSTPGTEKATPGEVSAREASTEIPPSEPPSPTVNLNNPTDQQAIPPANTDGNLEDPNCPICRIDVTEEIEGIVCEMCNTWSHRTCLFMPVEVYNALDASPDPWFCTTCLSIKSNKIKWGSLEG